MNLRELRQSINLDIDDEIENVNVDKWINRALDDLSIFSEYTQKATIQIAAGTTDYTLPSNLLKILSVGQNIRRLAINDFSSIGYKTIGNTLSLQPAPAEDFTMDIVYTSPLPHLVNDEDIPVIPSNFHNLIVLYVVARYKFADEEYEPQSIANQEYESKKQEFLTYIRSQKAVTNRVIDVFGMCWNG